MIPAACVVSARQCQSKWSATAAESCQRAGRGASDETDKTALDMGQRRFVAAIDLVVRRKLDDACVWAMFAIVCSVQNRHRAELDRLRIEAIVTHRMIAAIVAEQARLQKGNR